MISLATLPFRPWKLLPTSFRKISFFRMKNRELIGLSGSTASKFLQGLVTNDISLLKKPNSFLYSMFLNPKGRILSDTFIYYVAAGIDNKEDQRFLLECDASVRDKLLRMLSMYNLHKKIKVWKEESLATWVVVPSDSSLLIDKQAWNVSHIFLDHLVFCAADPRGVPGWSGRVLAKVADASAMTDSLSDLPVDLVEQRYHYLRYRLGIPEGPVELKAGDGMALEANGDITGGVSFNKGCYVGQELTTRSHFVGVIRRRIAPIQFTKPTDITSFQSDSPIYWLDSKTMARKSVRPIGWIRGASEAPVSTEAAGQMGIALIRMAEVADATRQGDLLWTPCRNDSSNFKDEKLQIDQTTGALVCAFRPAWWPDSINCDLPPISHNLVS